MASGVDPVLSNGISARFHCSDFIVPIDFMKSRSSHLLAILSGWVVLILVASPLAFGASEMRVWKDQQGRTVEAAFVKVEAGMVHLKLADGRVVPFPYDRLSAEDQEVVKKEFRSDPASLAAQIDAFVSKKLAEVGASPNPMTTDEQFVRRVYLEIAGAIPTFDQVVDFLESTDRDKRRKLIDKLLDSEQFVSHSFNWYADQLRLVSRTNDFFIFENYIQWVKVSIRENKPYDQFVREMLAAEGSIWENPASGYYLRDRGMPLSNLSVTVGLFLGTEITCAECHDHPFEEWTQRDFYGLAAFLGQRQDTPFGMVDKKAWDAELARIEQEQRAVDPSLGSDGYVQPFRLALSAKAMHVWDNPQRRLTLPHDYKYKDGKPGDPVEPMVLFGENVDLSKYESPRQAFADWVVSKKNPLFSKTLVNRLWKRAFGLGLHEPLDNLAKVENSQNPELFLFLEQAIQDLDFDVKEFLRAIYYSQAWQRQATLSGPTLAEISGNKYPFPGPLLKRMSAQQLWDSFLTLTLPDPMRLRRDTVNDLNEQLVFDITKMTGAESIKRVQKLQELMSRTIYQGAPSLKLWNNERTVRDGDQGGYVKFSGSYLARASELAQPAQASHFLRAWGQGDRSLVDGSSDNGSIPQILTMINGPFTQMLVKPDSLIFKTVGGERGTGDRMDKIYLSILSRYPQGREKAICARAIRSDDEGYGDLIWALVNTREFLFIR